jgi:hypothetical protein
MLGSAMLLHVAQPPAERVSVDGGIALFVAAAVIASAATNCVLACGPMARRMLRRGPVRRTASTACAVVVMLAVLPSVLPYDHIFAHDAGVAEAQDAVHASHCHMSPGTCSDAPVTAGPGQFILGDPLIVAPAMLAVLMAIVMPMLFGRTLRPELRPPLPAAT